MDRIRYLCARLSQASLRELNAFISLAREQGLLTAGEDAASTRENVARLCEKWANIEQRGAKRRRPESPGSEGYAGDPRLLLDVPGDVRRLFLKFADDWDVVARLCQTNRQLGKWCREKNVWLFLLQTQFNRQELFEGFRDVQDFSENFFSENPHLREIVTISQPDPDVPVADIAIRKIPDWASENVRAFGAAVMFSDQINTRPWMEYFVITTPDGKPMQVSSDLGTALLQFPAHLRHLTHGWWANNANYWDDQNFSYTTEVVSANQIRAFYEMWKDWRFRWKTPRAQESEHVRPFEMFYDPETHILYERDPESGYFTVSFGFRAGGDGDD